MIFLRIFFENFVVTTKMLKITQNFLENIMAVIHVMIWFSYFLSSYGEKFKSVFWNFRILGFEVS